MLEHVAIWFGAAALAVIGVFAWGMAAFSMWATPADWVGPNREFAARIRKERLLFNFGIAALVCALLLALLCLVPHVH